MGFFAVLFGYGINGVIFGLITKYVASSKGYDGGFAWGFFLGIVGLLVVGFRPNLQSQTYAQNQPNAYSGNSYSSYLSSSSSGQGSWQCVCGAKNSPGVESCQSCGKARRDMVPEKKVLCPHCGAKNNQSNPVCFACAKPMVIEPESPAVPAFDEIDILEKLAKLHQQGILTDEEFASKKAAVLAKM